jgi:hypothetical protein
MQNKIILFSTLLIVCFAGCKKDNPIESFSFTETYSYVHSFAVSGTNIIAGTDNGVFISTDNGLSWVNKGLRGITIMSLTVSGKNVYAGTSGNGVVLSTDNGMSWSTENALNGGPSADYEDYYVKPGLGMIKYVYYTSNSAGINSIMLNSELMSYSLK